MTGAALDLRRELLRLVSTFPGLHLRELARQTNVSESLAGYHLAQLVEAGLVESVEEEFFRRFYPAKGAAPAEEDRDLVSLLRQRVPLQIALLLLEHGSQTQADLGKGLGIGKSTVSYHVSRMSAAGVLDAKPGRVTLVDPKRVERLLLRWQPPKDLTDRMVDLWTGFYGSRRPGSP